MDQPRFGINQIGPERLGSKKIRDETKVGFDVEERRELAVVRRPADKAHHPPSEREQLC